MVGLGLQAFGLDLCGGVGFAISGEGGDCSITLANGFGFAVPLPASKAQGDDEGTLPRVAACSA